MPANSLRVALVDDNADILESMSMVMQLLGHESATCSDGRSALECIETWHPHVAFVDLGLPGMSGLDVARAVRERHNGSTPMLIAMTGWGRDVDRERALEAGFHKHVTKPLDLSQLRTLLGDVG